MTPRRNPSVSPLRPPREVRRSSRHRHGHRSPARDIDVSPGYCVEWNEHGQRRRGLMDVEDLRRRLLLAREGRSTLLVVHDFGARVLAVLRDAGGVDEQFVEAHATGGIYMADGCWSWEYPDGPAFRRVSLWTGPSAAAAALLLVDRPQARLARTPPRLYHQDAVRRTSTLDPPSPLRYGPRRPGIDVELCGRLGADKRAVEDVLCELAYCRWLEYLNGIGAVPRREEPSLWAALGCLERNQEAARVASCSPRVGWEGLVERVYRRLSLVAGKAGGEGAAGGGGRTDSERRSLDRISYLGGILLPVTVVAGVMAIGGEYGPGGSGFWIFWVVSVAASVVAVGVIYLDQVRALQVWIEVVVDAALEEEQSADADTLVVETDGGAGLGVGEGYPVRAWRRRDLGWGGALKKVSGYYRWRGTPAGLLFEMPGSETVHG